MASLVKFRVVGVEKECVDVFSILLDPISDSDAVQFFSGQYLSVVTDPGLVNPWRSYSIVSSPNESRIRLLVKVVPDGAGSSWMVSRRPGDIVEAARPAGKFTLPDNVENIVAFAAGIGITAVFSVCREAIGREGVSMVRLVYSIRNLDSAALIYEVRKLLSLHSARFDFREIDRSRRGRLERSEVLSALSGVDRPYIFVCGPVDYMAMVLSAVESSGVPIGGLVTEEFFGVKTGRVSDILDGLVARGDVKLRGETISVRWPSSQTLLEALDLIGVDAPSSCRDGQCLTCECRVVDGSVSMDDCGMLDESEVAEGVALACQMRPETEHVSVVFE